MKDIFSMFKNTDMFSHITSLRYIPRWVVLFIDIVICIVSYYLAFGLAKHFLAEFSVTHFLGINQKLYFLLGVQIVFFWVFHTYSGVLRYSGYVDAIKLLFAVWANVALMIIINLVINRFYNFSVYFTSGLILYGVIAFVLLFLVRLTAKTLFDFFTENSGNITPVMIYGTQSVAVGIAKMLRSNNDGKKYKLVGFLDDDKDASERVIMGVKVYHLDDKVVKKVVAKKAKSIIVSPAKMNQIHPEKDLDVFINNNLSVLIFPPMSIWNNDTLPSIKQIKSVQIEDLLERPMIEISTEKIGFELKNKVVLITGAAGSIGSEIVNQVITYEPNLVVMLDQAESPMHSLKLQIEEKYPDQNVSIFLGDVRNQKRMEYLMDMYRPDYIFHAAAYKHVPMMEDHPIESIQTNVLGTKILADLAVKYGVSRFVMVSTDKAVNPTNVMGASKRIAEIYVQSLHRKLEHEEKNTKFVTTRFGNVLGSNGSVIPLFKSQIERGGPVTVTHPEIIRYFMTIPEACMLVLEAGVTGKGGEIFIFDMGNPVKIVNLARKMIRLAGYIPDVDVKIEYTGLRPGEKLYEELLNHKEKTTKTHNPKIMIAKVQEYDYDVVASQIDELINYSFMCKNFLTVTQMKKIVPEFISKNSEYERLDV